MQFRHTLMRGRRSSYREWVLSLPARSFGVGKTFAATYVGKELIKRGERVHFVPFHEMVRVYEYEGETERLASSDSPIAQSWSSMKLSLRTPKQCRTYSLESLKNSSGIEPTGTQLP